MLMPPPMHNGLPVVKRIFSPAEHTVLWRLMCLAAVEQGGQGTISFDANFPYTVTVLGQPFTIENFSRRGSSRTFYYAFRPGEQWENSHAWLIQIHKYQYLDLSQTEPIDGYLHGDEGAYMRDMTMLRTAIC